MLRVDVKGRVLAKRTLPFYGVVLANGELTLSSKELTFPYITSEFRIHFALNTNRTVRVKFFHAQDDNCPTTGEPKDHNVFSALGQVDFVTGDDETVRMGDEVEVPHRGTFVKMYADNLDSYDHTLHAEVEIWQIMGMVEVVGK